VHAIIESKRHNDRNYAAYGIQTPHATPANAAKSAAPHPQHAQIQIEPRGNMHKKDITSSNVLLETRV
jgi:hypothetical protein